MVDNENLVVELVVCRKRPNVGIAGIGVSDAVDKLVGSRVGIIVCEEAERLTQKCHELRIFCNSHLHIVFVHLHSGSEAVVPLVVLCTQAHDKRLTGVRIVVRHAVSAVRRGWAHEGRRV